MALFVNHLTHLDVSIWSPVHGLTGMSWRVNATLEGEIGADGMLLDFGEVKPWVKQILDDGPDHTLLVPEQAEGVRVTYHDASRHDAFKHSQTCLLEATNPYPFKMEAPSQALTALPTSEVSEADILAHCEALLNARLPTNVTGVRLTLEAERIEGAEFGYSHGLKRHLGNCQRIAHGHRSRLEIHQHGERVPSLEKEWSDWLQHRYLIEAQDIVEASPDDRVTCRYRATQGGFTLSLPKAATAILDTPTTIENIARWIAGQVAQQTGEPTRVVVFEGISKGATADASGE